MYCTVIKHGRYLRTRWKCRKFVECSQMSGGFYLLTHGQSERAQGPIHIYNIVLAGEYLVT